MADKDIAAQLAELTGKLDTAKNAVGVAGAEIGQNGIGDIVHQATAAALKEAGDDPKKKLAVTQKLVAGFEAADYVKKAEAQKANYKGWMGEFSDKIKEFLGLSKPDVSGAAQKFEEGIKQAGSDAGQLSQFKDTVHFKVDGLSKEAKEAILKDKDAATKLGDMKGMLEEDFLKKKGFGFDKAGKILAGGQWMKYGVAGAAAVAAVGAIATRPADPETGKKKWTFGRVISTALLGYAAIRIGVGAYHGQGWQQMLKNPVSFGKNLSR